ncbi:reverse transcriptase-like protein [Elysia marginata]|uniref:Reverse transcriptase-like protein n=1 Tax=Elysia marginata TaxID=1093978 RepID=A0AAV4EJC2_9GAST|nr:reverse transcriptase-like protein [Elysia marginata]
MNKYVENITTKAKKRLQLLKKLASSSWGSDKQTLEALSFGYVCSALEYGNSLITMCSQTTRETDRIQNNVLRLLNGGMRPTPTATCEILAIVEPLEMRREKAAMGLFERNKRMNTEHPKRKLVENWKPNTRLNQRSVKHYVANTKEKNFLPENRQENPR